ncbi:hypothetical protein Q0590_32085 [Rhodocytophaga aerolata]|uniref:Uncharacterized protein n=1 Tax=Rhodocytophaga aerolata TaxID=455078 RepID=A0ABT8RIF7_9BACT|nr:hypothetical protein [Rhodocytophaga aerolata]MDO1450958.1 hypothetical protein [Rhodocytophaga aerolata]
MKKDKSQVDRIVFDGPQRITDTKEYAQQVKKIRDEINLKYCELLKNEKNPFKRMYFQIKQKREIKRAIRQLTSLDKLYLHS